MKTNSTGTKYFPINLQKKAMVYNDSQPQISFSPPIKTNNIKNEISQIKLKKDLSTMKYTPDKQYTSIQQQINILKQNNQNNKSLNIQQKPNKLNESNEINNSRNMNYSYYKFYKSDTKEKNKNEIISSTTNSNIINGNINNNSSVKDILQNQINNKQIKPLENKDKNDFLRFSREKNYQYQYINNEPYQQTGNKQSFIQSIPNIRPSSKQGSSTNILNDKRNDKEKIQITIKNSILTKVNPVGKIETKDKPPTSTLSSIKKDDKRIETGETNSTNKALPETDKNGIKTATTKKLNLSSSTANFIKNKLKSSNEQSQSEKTINDQSKVELPSPEEHTSFQENIIKKPLKHYHQKSLSENANLEQGFGNINTLKKDDKLKDEEEALSNMADIMQEQSIINTLTFSNLVLTLDDKLDQNQIESKVDELIAITKEMKTENYHCYYINSKLPLNKVLNRLLRYYSILILLIKFGILEFLLNNMLQKKIKTVLKLFNFYLFDLIESSIVAKINKYYNNNNGGNKLQISKELNEAVNLFNSLNKKYIIKSLNIWTFEYQIKMYESKLTSQLRVFLE